LLFNCRVLHTTVYCEAIGLRSAILATAWLLVKGYDVRKLITEYPDKQITEYLNILPDCFASFFLASCDVVLKKLYRFRYRDICAQFVASIVRYIPTKYH